MSLQEGDKRRARPRIKRRERNVNPFVGVARAQAQRLS